MPTRTYSFTNAEKQLLIVVTTLQSRSRPADRPTIEAFGRDYFGMYAGDWSSAYTGLVNAGLLIVAGDCYRIAPQIQALAEQYCKDNPKHRFFYDEFFTRVEHSKAHATFCERVYGANLAQHGMLEMSQLNELLDVLALKPGDEVLELGCGNGMLAEYISDGTRACVTGIDSSAAGIAQATARTSGKRSRLTFITGDMLEVAFPTATFAAVIAIDTLYYAADLPQFLNRLAATLKPGGQMGLFYSAWLGEGEPKELLRADQTALGKALRQLELPSKVIDYSAQELAHWRKKLQVARELRADFEAEGNLFLYNKRTIEAEYHQPYVAAGNVSRYLYHVHME